MGLDHCTLMAWVVAQNVNQWFVWSIGPRDTAGILLTVALKDKEAKKLLILFTLGVAYYILGQITVNCFAMYFLWIFISKYISDLNEVMHPFGPEKSNFSNTKFLYMFVCLFVNAELSIFTVI